MEIQTKHLVDMKIPAGHQIKIMKEIDKLRQKRPEYQRTILPANTKSTDADIDMINSKLFKTATTPRPSSSSSIKNAVSTKSTDNMEFGTSTHDLLEAREDNNTNNLTAEYQTGGELLKGVYNEEESRASFLEALYEWRAGKKALSTANEENSENLQNKGLNDEKTKKVRFADIPIEEKSEDNENEGTDYISSKMLRGDTGVKKKSAPKKESFFLFGGGDWTLSEYPTQNSTGTDMSPR